MNNTGEKIVACGICRPYGAWRVAGMSATKIPLLAELGNKAWV
jgi:hypothetical protein